MFTYKRTIDNVGQFVAKGENLVHKGIMGGDNKALFFNMHLVASPEVFDFTLRGNLLVFAKMEESFIYDTSIMFLTKTIPNLYIIPESVFGDKGLVYRSLGSSFDFVDLVTLETRPCDVSGYIHGHYIVEVLQTDAEYKGKGIVIYDFLNECRVFDFSVDDYKDRLTGERELRISPSLIRYFDEKYIVFAVGSENLVVVNVKMQKIEHIVNVDVAKTNIAFSRGFGFHENSIFGFYGLPSLFWQLNLSSGEIIGVDMSERFVQHGVEPVGPTYPTCMGNHVLFPSNAVQNGAVERSIAALNLLSLDIDWKHIFSPDEVGMVVHQPVISDDYMYVHSQDWKLHVFQRTA